MRPVVKAGLFRVAAVVLALLLTFGLAEIALRLTMAERLQRNNHHQIFTEFDPVLGWHKKASFRGYHVTDEYSVMERMNAHGLRGHELPLAKPAGQRRVLLLGDSFVEGYAVDEEETVSEQLERLLDVEGDWEAINAGTGGYSTDQELLYFEREGRRFSPDVTVLMFYENDIAPNARDYHARYRFLIQKPLFAERDGQLQVVNLPLTVPPRRTSEDPLSTGFFDDYYVFRLAARWKAIEPLHDAAFHLGLIAPEAYEEDRMHRDQGFDAWPITAKLIERLAHATSEAHSRLLLFQVPTHAMDARDEEIERRLSALAGGQLRVPFVQTLARFRSETQRMNHENGRTLYYPLDGHWNAAGHAFAAQLLREALAHEGLLRSP